jgi:hypothetical protein
MLALHSGMFFVFKKALDVFGHGNDTKEGVYQP